MIPYQYPRSVESIGSFGPFTSGTLDSYGHAHRMNPSGNSHINFMNRIN
jgi:hypothetical protein